MTTKSLALILCFLSLTSCVQVFPPQEPSSTLLITAKFAENAEKWKDVSAVKWQLVISEPSVNAYLDKKLVMVEDQSGTVQYLSRARWPDNLPNFLQSLLVDTFLATSKIIGVSDSVLTVDPQYLLLLDFNKFNIQKTKDDTYTTVLEATARFIEFRTRKVIGLKSFKVSAPIQGVEKKEVVKAFTALLEKFTEDLIPWTLSQK